jgi:hypothetical protein
MVPITKYSVSPRTPDGASFRKSCTPTFEPLTGPEAVGTEK